MKIKFEFERETKNKLLYKAVSETAAIESIYIKKSSLKDLGIIKDENISIQIFKEEK